MVTEPAETPVTTPPEEIVALAVELLLHVPPAAEAVRVIVEPIQTADEPLIDSAVTVRGKVATALLQLLVTVYEMVTVPDKTPVTTPEELTDATVLFDVDQTPPIVESANVMLEPTPTDEAPTIALTDG
jgi:hypothetical protein